MSTITNNITQNITLGPGPVSTYPTFTSPLTIVSGGEVDPSSGAAIYGPNTAAWTIANYGILFAGGLGAAVIRLEAGGLVTNNGGVIEGFTGVYIYGAAGTVTNSNVIIGSAGRGVYLDKGGSISNTLGLIEGYGGVYIKNAAGTVTNSGTIVGTKAGSFGFGIGVDFAGGSAGSTLVDAGTIIGTGGTAVQFAGSGNFVVIDPEANFSGIVNGGTGSNTLELGSAAAIGTLSGFGTEYLGFTAVTVNAGADWLFGNGNTIGVGITLTDRGTLTNPGSIGTTVTLLGGGTVDNKASGTIAAATAVYGRLGAATVVNSGTIASTAPSGNAVFLFAGGSVANNGGLIEGSYDGVIIGGAAGTVTNSGTISATGTSGAGVYFFAGGRVANNGGLIEGATGVRISGKAGTVTNFYTITGTSGDGASLSSGGSIANNADLIQGSSNGVYIGGAAGTVTNSGTISATGTSGFGDGAFLKAGGSVANNAGLIEGSTGVFMNGAGTVSNSGTIRGTSGYGVFLSPGGSLANNGGLIEGSSSGVLIEGTAGTVTNSATIIGTGNGVYLLAGGSIGNATTGLIEGFTGIDVSQAAGTVVNSGTIIGTSGGDAVFATAGGSIANNAGLIEGSSTGVYIGGSAGAVTNSATIIGTGVYGVVLDTGGSVSNTGLIEGSSTGVVIVGGAGTVTNFATIAATATSGFGVGVNLSSGDSLTNSGLVKARTGVAIFNTSGTIVNLGTIDGTSFQGVYSTVGGSVTNAVGGLIEGLQDGGYLKGGAGTITNAGTIIGTVGDGVFLDAGGSVANTGPGLIEGSLTGLAIVGGAGTVANSGTIRGTTGVGVTLTAGGTVVDSGTISGGGTAIAFGGSGNLLVLELGYKLVGSANGGVSATNTLELSGTLGAVSVNYSGLSLTNFQDVLFGPSGNETLKATTTTGTLGTMTISGFTLTSDIVDLTAIGANGTIAGTIGTMVTVTGSFGSETLKLDGSDATAFTTRPDGSGGTDLVACFCRGTLILTERGEVAVEDLAIGDAVVTLSGAVRSIKWIGRRAYDGRFVAANRAVMPIRIAAEALGEGVPARELHLSPEHALAIDGVLVPAGQLVNGRNITQAQGVERLEYFHIELAAHDIIFAEGTPAETYVDCDNRFMFQNAGGYAALDPGDRRPGWDFCAPRLEPGSPELTAIRAALLERAEALGYALDSDPDLHLIVDGEILPSRSVFGAVYRFDIPAGSAEVWLASRSTIPAETVAASGDIRRLGVAVERLVLSDGELSIEAWHGHPGLYDGFHDDEATHRWTVGLGRLPEALLRPFAGGFTLELHLAPSTLAYCILTAERFDAAAA